MATLLEIYNENKIFRGIAKTTANPNFPVPTATPKPEPGILSTESGVPLKPILRRYYESFPVLNVNFSGQSVEPLVTIKPNSDASEYSTKLDYTLTRAGATAKWLISPNGMKFALNQTIMQAFNPQIVTKIWNPLSTVVSNYIPFTQNFERRHMTLSDPFGIPLQLLPGLSAASYTEAIWSDDRKSRNIYQSPLIAITSNDLAGINYANIARDVMTLPATWQKINPNKYSFPIGVDGAGLPNSSRITPAEEMVVNIGLATQGYRYTKAAGFNPILDGQITMNQQLGGSSFLQRLLKSIPYVNTILSYFGYGILGAEAQKIKIYNPYNVTFPYSQRRGTLIRVINDDGELLGTYDSVNDLETPLERLLYAIEQGTTIAKEKPVQGLQFVDRAVIERAAGYEDGFKDDRVLYNPQDDTPTINQYLQSYGDIMQKRSKDAGGTANIVGLVTGDDRKPYSKYMQEDVGVKVLLRPDGRGFANSGAKDAAERQGDALNLLPYGEDSKDKDFSDLIPFKFYHVNERKWIIFRATLNGLTDNISPEWNEKSYIGRADKLYIYKGATRKINFSFKVMINNPKELRPVYEKINYLIGLNYPKYQKLKSSLGDYMEAPFVQLTIGDLFTDVYGIIDGGVTITYPDDATWEVRDEVSDAQFVEGVQIAKVPRYVEITIGSFTPFSLDDKPISSTSPFYSAVKTWQEETV